MDKPKPPQFSLAQLLLGTALLAAWCFFFVVSLNRHPPELTDPNWEVVVFATPPIVGGLAGLAHNVKGMLIGIGIGLGVSTVLLNNLLPGVQ